MTRPSGAAHLTAMAVSCRHSTCRPRLRQASRSLLPHVTVEGAVRQIAITLCEGLSETGRTETPIRELEVRATRDPDGRIVALVRGTFYESSLFDDRLADSQPE